MKMLITDWLKGIAVALIISLCGCTEVMQSDKMSYPPAYPIDNPPPAKHNGTIYQEGYNVSLYNDRVANRVGDILTVRLEESTQGQKQAQTKANKTTSTNFLGPNVGVRNLWPQFNTTADQEFDGKGQTNEQNKLVGTISVTVTHVLANGNMVVQGESWITIDMGRENVILTGIVRPDDIGSDNTISSTRVAGARISYVDHGMDGDASRGGFMSQFLYKFFPY